MINLPRAICLVVKRELLISVTMISYPVMNERVGCLFFQYDSWEALAVGSIPLSSASITLSSASTDLVGVMACWCDVNRGYGSVGGGVKAAVDVPVDLT